jgi:hypothetical protein
VHVSTADHDLVAAVYERLGLVRTIEAVDVRGRRRGRTTCGPRPPPT